MSNPQNPLARFQTYSYHHFLVVCDSSQTAENLASPSADLTLFQRRGGGSAQPERRTLDPGAAEAFQQGYVVLIDGFSDAQFVIQSASWTSLLAPESVNVGGSELASMELDGEIDIIEPRGARLMEIIANAGTALNRDPIGLTWVLKTVFVGKRPDGRTETIANIKGVTFVVTDIQGAFDNAGATYKLQFVGAVNGVGHLPAVQQIVRGRSLPIEKGTTVREALEQYAAILNRHWLNEKTRLKNQLASAERFIGRPTGIDFDRDFARVRYVIKAEAEVFDRFLAGTNEQVAITNTGDGDPIINPGEIITVEGMIKKILDSSAEIQKEAQGEGQEERKTRFIYKILSGLESTNEEYIVTYHVKRFEVPVTPFDDIFAEGLEPAPGQFIEFDYIFTGQNTDILDFEMNMQQGLAFLQIISATNNTPSQIEAVNQSIVNGQTVGFGGVQRSTTTPERRTKTPLFLGTKLTDPIFRHKRQPLDTIGFQSVFGRWAGFENLETKVKITGNPQLLSDTTPLPSELEGDNTTEPLEGAGADSTVAPSWTTRPVLTKINVKFPSDNTDGDFAETFWWPGFYYMYSIRHSFDDGLFTQDLEMFSIIEDDGLFDISDDPLIEALQRQRSAALATDIAATEAQLQTVTAGTEAAQQLANLEQAAGDKAEDLTVSERTKNRVPFIIQGDPT